MTISFEIPCEIEQELGGNGADVNGEAREAFLVELYRQERITLHQLAEALGLNRYETDGVLKRHKVWLELTSDALSAQKELKQTNFRASAQLSQTVLVRVREQKLAQDSTEEK